MCIRTTTLCLTIFTAIFSISSGEKHLEKLILQMLHKQSPLETKSEKTNGKNDPVGCYSEKELIDVLKLNSSKSKPIRPRWCNENGLLIPTSLAGKKPQTGSPPYRIVTTNFTKSDTFRVTIECVEPKCMVSDVVLVARGTHYSGSYGRFLEADGVKLICCSYMDKDVARFRKKEVAKQAIFYWVPYEVVDDFEGSFIFQATIAKNPDEYWTNVTSQVLHFQSS